MSALNPCETERSSYCSLLFAVAIASLALTVQGRNVLGSAKLVIGEINTRDPARPMYDITLPSLGTGGSSAQNVADHRYTGRDPVNDLDVDVLRVVTAHGQGLLCKVPKPPSATGSKAISGMAEKRETENSEDTAKSHEAESLDDLTGVEELLDVYRGRCFQREEGWWTYSFCYGLHVEQKHDASPTSNEESVSYMLGVFDPEYDAERRAARPHEVQMEDAPYTQLYGNGTRCDISGRPREIIVKYKCNQEALQIGMPSLVGLNFISALREVETCVYEIDFVNEEICHHPAYKTKREKSILHINCAMELQKEPFLGLSSDSYRRASLNL